MAEDPAFKKYFKLKSMDMSVDQIKMKMEADGVDPTLLDTPSKVSPNDPGVRRVFTSNGWLVGCVS